MTEQQKIRHASTQALIDYSLGGLSDAAMAALPVGLPAASYHSAAMRLRPSTARRFC